MKAHTPQRDAVHTLQRDGVHTSTGKIILACEIGDSLGCSAPSVQEVVIRLAHAFFSHRDEGYSQSNREESTDQVRHVCPKFLALRGCHRALSLMEAFISSAMQNGIFDWPRKKQKDERRGIVKGGFAA